MSTTPPEHDPQTEVAAEGRMSDLLATRLADPKRRSVLKASAWAALLCAGPPARPAAAAGRAVDAATARSPAEADGSKQARNTRPAALGFAAVAKSLADDVIVADGYQVDVLYRLGDPLAAGVPAFRNDGDDDAASFARRAGDHHDGLYYFGLGRDGRWRRDASERGLLCVNHESVTTAFLHVRGATIAGKDASARRLLADEVLREFFAHGVSVIEVRRDRKRLAVRYRQDSQFNRRIHTLTDMALSGPAAATSFMVTKYSPDGRRTRGTLNNCANGHTPWGTYLTCEENWAGYFRRVPGENAAAREFTAKELVSFARYGIGGNGRLLWATVDPGNDLYARWNVALKGETAADDYRNAANTFGWVVEIDPFDPRSTPRKRTALGRFAHEGAWPAKVEAGRPLVYYMGCDASNEYVYKYVSNRTWDPADADGGLAAGDKYLDDGQLYAARFNADGSGEWLRLHVDVPAIRDFETYPFADQADLLVNARIAADAVGATRMDRPEWGAVDPVTGDVYMTLTNNAGRSDGRRIDHLDAANPRFYREAPTSPSRRAREGGNPNGHIIRFSEPSPQAGRFDWDIYVFGARAGRDENVNVSALTADNEFSSPDGLWFSPTTKILWIETDDSAMGEVSNDMLLAALPGAVGDGGPRTITSSDGETTRQVQTFAGAPPGARLKRFLVGVPGCEITGVAETPDGRTLFVNIQHPGENTPASAVGEPHKYESHWPDGGLARPRSSTLVITRNDKGRIGL